MVRPADAAGTPPPPPPPPKKPPHDGIFRWRGVAPLLLLLALAIVGYIAFSDPVAEETLEEAASKALGTQVDIAAFRILEAETALEMDGLQIADPFDPMRNLLEIAGVRVELERDPLLEKKAVIRRLTIREVRAGTRRRTPARPGEVGGFAPEALRAVRTWRSQFDLKPLAIARFDTVKSLVLDPRQLGTVQAAVALRDRADSTRQAVEAEVRGLRLVQTLDSARALADRIAEVQPRTLGIPGARALVVDVRRTLDSVRAAKARVDALRASTLAGVAALRAGVGGLDSARREDYAFARSLLDLPTFAAPDIGDALLGDVTISRFEKLLYYSELAQEYAPAGLRPRETPGPERTRASGTTLRFAKVREYPSFLLRRADVDFKLVGNALTAGDYALTVVNATSQPALVGRPMEFLLTRKGGGSSAALSVRGASDHRAMPVDVVKADLAALPLPAFDLPGLPFRLDLNQGASQLEFTRRGQNIAGRWVVNANRIRWQVDSARVQRANYVERLLYRVIGGLDGMDIEARIGGTIDAPQLAVSSTLDRAIAAELRQVFGEEIARAERLVRSKVDSLVRDREAEARERVEALRLQAEDRLAELQARIDAERARLDEEREKLETRIKQATGGALGLPELPRTQLPAVPRLPQRRPRPDSGG